MDARRRPIPSAELHALAGAKRDVLEIIHRRENETAEQLRKEA